MKKVRWGLLSTANINRRLIPAIRASERGELTAVASRSKEKVEAYAREWEIPQTFDSYEAMLQSDAIDAVYISLPNHLHAEWSIYAMKQGKHVLCEKPFVLTMAEMDAVEATAVDTGMTITEAFMYRHHPQTKLVGDWVREGRLGDLMLMRGSFNFAFNSRENVRLVADWGGGSLWDVGVYPMSFAQYVMGGPPTSVLGDQWIGPTKVDESFAGQLHYGADGSGLTAQISCSFRSPFYTWFEIIGTDGRLTLNRPFVGMDQGRKLLFHKASGEVEEIAVPEKELYSGEVEDLHDSILDGFPSYLSLNETRNHVRTVLALYESAQTRQIVHL